MPPNLTNLVRRLRRLAEPPAADSDADLLGRFARRRDEDAFAALVARHGPMVFGVCRRMLRDAHAAEDAAQATFLVLARRAGSIGRPDRLAGWLYGVAYRVAWKARSGALRRGETALSSDQADGRPDPLSEVSARELLEALEAELRRLPEAYRLPLVLCCLEGLSQEEAAGRLGCTPDAVRGRLERGRRRLHGRLGRRGLALPAALAAVLASRGGVSAALVRVTVRGAVAFASGGGGVSQRVIALADGGLKAMFWTKMKVALVVLALSGALGSGAGWVMTGGREPAGGGLVVPVAAAEPEQKVKPKRKEEDTKKAEREKAATEQANRERDALVREQIVAQARRQLDAWKARDEVQDQVFSKKLIDARSSLAELEERLREEEAEMKAARLPGAEESLLAKQEERQLEAIFRVKNQEGLREADVAQLLKPLERPLAVMRAAREKFERDRHAVRRKGIGTLLATRKAMIAKEEEIRQLERARDIARQESDRRREVLLERIYQLEGTAPAAAPDRGQKALDRKLDAIQRELGDLRREMRRRKE